jgi:DNA-binding CsgD family transcriptional regulator
MFKKNNSDMKEPATSNKLTQREIECLYWACQGKSLEETAMLLKIAHKTAVSYVRNAKIKLNATKIAQAIYLATKKGLI